MGNFCSSQQQGQDEDKGVKIKEGTFNAAPKDKSKPFSSSDFQRGDD